MFWNIAGVKNVFTPGIKLYSVRVYYPKMLHYCYIHARYDPIWHYHSHWTSRIIDRVEINVLEYPRGQKYFHPGDETVFREGLLPKNAALWLHSCWIMTQYVIIIAIETLESLVGDIHWGTLGPHKALLDTFQVSSCTLSSAHVNKKAFRYSPSPLKSPQVSTQAHWDS